MLFSFGPPVAVYREEFPIHNYSSPLRLSFPTTESQQPDDGGDRPRYLVLPLRSSTERGVGKVHESKHKTKTAK